MERTLERACQSLGLGSSVSIRAKALLQSSHAVQQESSAPSAVLHWAASAIFNALFPADFAPFSNSANPPARPDAMPTVAQIYAALRQAGKDHPTGAAQKPDSQDGSVQDQDPASFFECAMSLAYDVQAAREGNPVPKGSMPIGRKRGGRRREARKSEAIETLRRMQSAWEVVRGVFVRAKKEAVFSWVDAAVDSEQKEQTVWAMYVAVKSAISLRTPDAGMCPAQDRVSAWHLLVATLILWQGVDQDQAVASGKMLQMCENANASLQKVMLFISEVKSILPSQMLQMLPVVQLDKPSFSVLHSAVVKWYLTMNKETGPCTVIDERVVFRLEASTETRSVDSRLLSTSQLPESVEDDIRMRYPAGMATPVLARKRTFDQVDTENDSPPFATPRRPITNPAAACSPLDALAAAAASQTPQLKTVIRNNKTATQSFVPSTPFSGNIASVQWLEKLASNRLEVSGSPAPSTGLSKYVPAGSDLWNNLLASAYELSEEAFRPNIARGLSPTEVAVLAIRQKEAMALYFTALEGILTSEERRLKRTTFDGLIFSSSFQQSIMACAAEATSAAYGRVNYLPFPSVLETFDLQPYEMSKIVMTFIEKVPKLPRPIFRHIAFCQERILESLAWREDSPLVLALQARSKKKDGEVPKMQSAATNEVAMSYFFRDMMLMASSRIADLSQRVGFSDATRTAVWNTLKFVLSERWELLVNRHLDQLLLCCVYGIDKVRPPSSQRPPLKFKVIIDSYRVLPHVCSPSFSNLMPGVYRDVRLDQAGSIRGDVIKFYNGVFIIDEGIKAFLLSQSGGSGGATSQIVPQSPGASTLTGAESPDRLKAQIAASPMRVRSGNTPHVIQVGQAKLRISPMSPWNRRAVFNGATGTPVSLHNIRQTPAKAAYQMTPNTKLLHAFGETPGIRPSVALGSTPSRPGQRLGIPPQFLSPPPRTPGRRVSIGQASNEEPVADDEGANLGSQDMDNGSSALMRKYGVHISSQDSPDVSEDIAEVDVEEAMRNAQRIDSMGSHNIATTPSRQTASSGLPPIYGRGTPSKVRKTS